MRLSKDEFDGLMRLVGLTKNNEINCEQCLGLVSEFAETAVVGKSVPEGLKAVEHHLAICTECREEYEALEKALREMYK